MQLQEEINDNKIWLSISVITNVLKSDFNGSEYLKSKGHGFIKVSNYLGLRISSEILIPNLGFLFITFLAFYLSEILKVSKKLKDELDLTI